MHKNGSTSLEGRFGSLRESMRNLVDAGGERAGHIKNRAIDAKDKVLESGEEYVGKLGKLIKNHPFATIAIAFGIGYVAVRMMRR